MAATDRDIVTLKEYLDSRLHAIEKATAIALAATDKRFESVNEFRNTLRDQQAMFATLAEVKNLREDIQSLKESRAELAGKASQQSVIVAYILSLLGLVLSALSLVKASQG